MKKQLPTEAITSELNQSVFFQKPPDAKLADQPQDAPKDTTSHSPSPSVQELQRREGAHQASNEARQQAVMTDVTHDVITSQLEDVNLRKWQEIIEDTETQNSALRLTSEERYAVEDAIHELRRKYGIKTSMNEIARLGLLLLLSDFKQHKKESMIHKVKKA